VAIGLLEEDGLLCLDDKIVDHFPEKIETEVPEYLRQLTIRQMLTMETCSKVPTWFKHTDPDRTHLYLNENDAPIPGGMRFKYDSPGSQVLSSLVEKLSGQTLFDFLNQRIFRHLDAFQTATILKTPNGDSFGDSALVCTPRDMAAFARFVMNYGTWNGQRLMNEAYLRTATSKVVDSHDSGFDDLESYGYGYQFWRSCFGRFRGDGIPFS
jgi:CubicO group peptidase (beta-lactamase class C family)